MLKNVASLYFISCVRFTTSTNCLILQRTPIPLDSCFEICWIPSFHLKRESMRWPRYLALLCQFYWFTTMKRSHSRGRNQCKMYWNKRKFLPNKSRLTPKIAGFGKSTWLLLYCLQHQNCCVDVI